MAGCYVTCCCFSFLSSLYIILILYFWWIIWSGYCGLSNMWFEIQISLFVNQSQRFFSKPLWFLGFCWQLFALWIAQPPAQKYHSESLKQFSNLLENKYESGRGLTCPAISASLSRNLKDLGQLLVSSLWTEWLFGKFSLWKIQWQILAFSVLLSSPRSN